MFDIGYVEQLQAKKSKLYDMMAKYPEREQELAQEYFSIEQEITKHFRNIPTLQNKGNVE